MSGKKYSFSKEIAESLGITEAIILDFFQNNRENFSLSILKDEFRFLDVSQIENSYQKLDNLGLFNNIPAKVNASNPDESMNFYPSEDLVKQAFNLGIEEDFLGDQLPSFNLFWKGKDLKPHLKESKFLQYALKNWREKEKIEYTIRTIRSLLNSSKDPDLKQLKINFKVIDHNSNNGNLASIEKVFTEFNEKYSLINLDVSKFINKIEKTNQRGESVTDNQISNMANIHQSLLEAKKCEDLIYFVEDDYIHKKESLKEMIFTYERLASQINNEIIICPTDYPYLYAKSEMTQNFLGQNYHWRKVNETLCTFLTSKKMIEKYWDKYVSMCEKEHAPFEKPLHDIYEKELCISPIPSLALHFTNVNSIFGLSPNVNWKKVWDQNEN